MKPNKLQVTVVPIFLPCSFFKSRNRVRLALSPVLPSVRASPCTPVGRTLVRPASTLVRTVLCWLCCPLDTTEALHTCCSHPTAITCTQAAARSVGSYVLYFCPSQVYIAKFSMTDTSTNQKRCYLFACFELSS